MSPESVCLQAVEAIAIAALTLYMVALVLSVTNHPYLTPMTAKPESHSTSERSTGLHHGRSELAIVPKLVLLFELRPVFVEDV